LTVFTLGLTFTSLTTIIGSDFYFILDFEFGFGLLEGVILFTIMFYILTGGLTVGFFTTIFFAFFYKEE
jgi:hypothetical protein